MIYYTFESNGRMLYLGVDYNSYHTPLFVNHSDACEYAARYGVNFTSLIEVEVTRK